MKIFENLINGCVKDFAEEIERYITVHCDDSLDCYLTEAQIHAKYGNIKELKKLDLSKLSKDEIIDSLIQSIIYDQYNVFLYIIDYCDLKNIDSSVAVNILNFTVNYRFISRSIFNCKISIKTKIKIFNDLLLRGIDISYYVESLKHRYGKDISKEFRDIINFINRKMKIINKKIKNNQLIEI